MRKRTPLAVVLAVAMTVTIIPVAFAATPQEDFTIEVLSSRPDVVSGGDARIAVGVPEAVAAGEVSVTLNNVDVTDQLSETDDGLEGVVSGLQEGRNVIRVASTERPATANTAQVLLTNHPISGPMFSGPHQEPFICETEAAGLGAALDEDCFAETKVELRYVNTSGTLVPYPTTGTPDDVAETTTTLGTTVDFVVRVETGVINRAVYQTAVLFDPTAPETDSDVATAGWNGRLVYSYGGGCNAGYHQGQGNGGVLDLTMLGLGYGTASSSLNVLDNNCNHVLSAETTSMVKEHFIETYGSVEHTIGWGGSGGAISQHMIGQAYPGLLDGIIPTLSYPDPTTILPGIADCRLINNYITSGGGSTLDDDDLRAIVGHANYDNCLSWTFSFSNRIVADEGCPSALPVALRYDPVTNPDGARCTVTDHVVNLLGINPETGVAYTLFDNVGVQYGLDALNSGQITVDEFLELNRDLGGYDTDGHFAPDRTAAHKTGLRRAYETGLVQAGAGGLSTMPIIDLRPYLDPVADIHVRFHSFSTRERLIAANGEAGNQVIQVAGDFGTWAAQAGQSLLLMDEWLTNIESSTAERTYEEVVAAKPAALVDGCWDQGGQFVAEPATYDGPGTCNTLYPSFGDPRTAAGGPVISDIVKCQTTRPLQSDYAVEFTPDQWAELESIFSSGVCDWDAVGVGQSLFKVTWPDFGS